MKGPPCVFGFLFYISTLNLHYLYSYTNLNIFQIPYEAKIVQIKFLQSLHDKVEQEITYHCKNTVAYRDAQTKSKDNALMFMTFNGDWLSANSKKKFRYKVKDDDCQVGRMVLFLQKLSIPENLSFICFPFFIIGYFFFFLE